ncbi:MAG: DUF3592 domain-containing protein [Acidobacteriota bacterium]
MKDKWPFWFGASIFGLVGLGISWLTIGEIRETSGILSRTALPGEVISLEEGVVETRHGTETRRASTMIATIRYVAPSGETLELEESSALLPRLIEVGDAVTVLHVDDQPELARMKSTLLLWGPCVGLLVLSLGFLGGAALILKMATWFRF